MCIEQEITPGERHLQILQKTAELVSIETPDLSPVGHDRAAKILKIHREIRDLITGALQNASPLEEAEVL